MKPNVLPSQTSKGATRNNLSVIEQQPRNQLSSLESPLYRQSAFLGAKNSQIAKRKDKSLTIKEQAVGF